MSKAQTSALLTFIVAGIIVGVFFAGFMFFFNSLTNTMTHITTGSNIINITDASSKILVPVNNAMSGLNAISVALILGLILGMFVEVYYVRKNPILFAVHLLIVILSVTASLYISNRYEALMSDSILGSYLTANSGLSFLTLNLPLITTLIGFLTLIIMFIAINRDSEYSRNNTI